jgi:hypothetical protein
MTNFALDSLEREAARKYERARFANGAAFAVLVAAPFGCASLACCMFPTTTVVLGSGLAATLGVARYRGMWLARGLNAGLVAGALGFVLPILCRALMPGCDMTVLMMAMFHVPLSWVAAIGVGVGALSVARAPQGSRAPAFVVAILLASLGALAGGPFGPVAIAAGAVVGAALVLAIRKAGPGAGAQANVAP